MMGNELNDVFPACRIVPQREFRLIVRESSILRNVFFLSLGFRRSIPAYDAVFVFFFLIGSNGRVGLKDRFPLE